MSCNIGDWSPKDPADVVGYAFDWSGVLLVGEEIATADFAVEPNTLTLDSDFHDDTTATVIVSDGVEGANYTISCTITTTADVPQTFKRSQILRVLKL